MCAKSNGARGAKSDGYIYYLLLLSMHIVKSSIVVLWKSTLHILMGISFPSLPVSILYSQSYIIFLKFDYNIRKEISKD